MTERARDLGAALERIARLRPDRPAVSDPQESLTYGRLLESARDLAASLPPPARSEAPGAVAMLMPHRAGTVVAAIASLLAGRPYCVINPAQPARRLEGLLAAIRPELVWASDADLRRRLAAVGAPVTAPTPSPARDGDPRPPPARSGGLCALYVTSGSSGSPKVVGYTHGATHHRAERYATTIGADSGDRFSLVSPLWTAASASALFTALLSGASLRVLEPGALAPQALRAEVATSGITVWHSIPSLFRRLAGAGLLDANRFRVLRLGGEPVLPTDIELARRSCGEDTLLVTGYSLTEANGVVTQKAVPLGGAGADTAADAGPAIPGIQVEVTDRNGDPLPAGEEGEIVVSGEHLSAGYAGPDGPATGTRFRRRGRTPVLHTGDRGVLRADGTVEVRGREDGRLKIRGHRVDPNEVQAAALAHGGVLDAAVVPFAPRGGGGAAIALLAVPERRRSGLSARSLSAHLEARIAPEAMPAIVRVLDELPLSASGKVDRPRLSRLLDDRGPGRPAGGGSGEPLIAALLQIWREALEIDDLGADDDFFALGGDSLAAVEVCAAVESAYGVPMEPATLLRRRTVKALGAHLRDLLGGAPAVPATVLHLNEAGGEAPLFVVPGAGSDATALIHFAEAIGADQPVNVIQLPGADGRSRPLTRMDRIASHCLAAIDRTGARPPFRIAGTSFGGLVAYLIASELLRRGREVEYLGLFDTAAPQARRRHHLTDPLHRLGLGWNGSPRRLRTDFRAELTRIRTLLANLLIDYALTLSLLLGLDVRPRIEWRFRYLMAGAFMAARGWTPPPMPIPTHLYRCESQPRFLAGAPLLGWDRHGGEIVVRRLRSRHGHHIRPPAVDELAALVSADLRRSRERQASRQRLRER